jgi:hypothetical protein
MNKLRVLRESVNVLLAKLREQGNAASVLNIVCACAASTKRPHLRRAAHSLHWASCAPPPAAIRRTGASAITPDNQGIVTLSEAAATGATDSRYATIAAMPSNDSSAVAVDRAAATGPACTRLQYRFSLLPIFWRGPIPDVCHSTSHYRHPNYHLPK